MVETDLLYRGSEKRNRLVVKESYEKSGLIISYHSRLRWYATSNVGRTIVEQWRRRTDQYPIRVPSEHSEKVLTYIRELRAHHRLMAMQRWAGSRISTERV